MTIHTAVATIHTNHGDIVVNLFGDQAPRTVANFTGLADGSQAWTDPATGKPGEGPLYTDVIFHRIISELHDPGRRPARSGCRRPCYNFR
ncbi:MAG: peptidylprolyl isomerase [Microbacterium sp.]